MSNLPLAQRLQGADRSRRSIAHALGINHADVVYFVCEQYKKIGRRRRRLIRQWMIKNGFMTPPKPRVRCLCERCGKVHVEGKKRRMHSQSESGTKNFATPKR